MCGPSVDGVEDARAAEGDDDGVGRDVVGPDGVRARCPHQAGGRGRAEVVQDAVGVGRRDAVVADDHEPVGLQPPGDAGQLVPRGGAGPYLQGKTGEAGADAPVEGYG